MSDNKKALLEDQDNTFWSDKTELIETAEITVIDESDYVSIERGNVLSTKDGDVEFIGVGNIDMEGTVTSLIVRDIEKDVRYELQVHRVTGIIK